MRKNLLRNMILTAAIIILAVTAAAAVLTHGHTDPHTSLDNQAAELTQSFSPSDIISLQSNSSSENTSLSNQITQKQKEKREQEMSDGREDGGGQEETGDPADQSGAQPPAGDQSADDPGGQTPQGYDPDTYEDLPEDAYVQESLPIDDLLEEIGIDDPSQIIYAKSVSGGKSTLLKLVNGAYSVLLDTRGTTVIQIRYTDSSGQVQTFTKKITYQRPEDATPEEKRPVISTNLQDEGIYTSRTLNFDVWITNYRGKPLAYNNMEVTVNGSAADYVGEMGRQTYTVQLKTGANTIRIKVKDTYQYTVTKEYTVYYRSGSGTITISLEAGTLGLKYLIQPQKMEVESGTPLSYVVDEFLTANGFSYSASGTLDDGFYLAKVQKAGLLKGYRIPSDLIQKLKEDRLIFDEENFESLDVLGERDFSEGSGWMYSINGLYSSYGFNKAYVQNGDVVRLRFTLAYGKDIGGYSVTSGSYGTLQDYGKEW